MLLHDFVPKYFEDETTEKKKTQEQVAADHQLLDFSTGLYLLE